MAAPRLNELGQFSIRVKDKTYSGHIDLQGCVSLHGVGYLGHLGAGGRICAGNHVVGIVHADRTLTVQESVIEEAGHKRCSWQP